MPKRLLARQTELLDYLTSAAAIFGDNRDTDQPLTGFDRRLLNLEARLSRDKRLEKVRRVFTRTLAILGDAAEWLIHDFTATCPPSSIETLENAWQFYTFMTEWWERVPPLSSHLPDVAACELALAEVNATGPISRGGKPGPGCRVRRMPGIVLLRCRYAIRPIFEEALPTAVLEPCDTRLAIGLSGGGDYPQVFEVSEAVYELLTVLDDFTKIAELGSGFEVVRLMGELAKHGLIETAP